MRLASPAKLPRARLAFLLAAAIAVAAFAASFGTARAATVTVTNTADAGVGSLRAQIAAADPGDTIDFGAIGPVITLTSGQIVIDTALQPSFSVGIGDGIIQR